MLGVFIWVRLTHMTPTRPTRRPPRRQPSVFDHEALKLLMEDRGLSDAELAQLADVSESAIYKWRNGQRSPRPRHYARLVAALRVPPGYFFRRKKGVAA